jgi:hypothetical protein
MGHKKISGQAKLLNGLDLIDEKGGGRVWKRGRDKGKGGLPSGSFLKQIRQPPKILWARECEGWGNAPRQ